MKLKEYFFQEKMPEKNKLIVYEKIRNQIERESIFLKLSFYTKVGVYSIILLVLFFGLFYHTPSTQKISQNIALETTNNTVFADYIGKVITATGDFKILDDGKEIKSKFLKKGSVLVLNNNANITLQVNHGIKMHIVGPAKIQLDKYKNDEGKDIYVFNMIDGKYLAVKSNSAKDKIVIKSKYINISSADQYIDLRYESTGNATIIENNGGNILVQKNKKVLSLSAKEKLVILNKESLDHLKNILSDNYKSYQLDTNGQLRQILSSDQIKKLSNILNKKLVILAVGKFVLGKLNQDKQREQSGKKELIRIIENTYTLFGFNIPSFLKVKIDNNDLTLADMENLVDNLISQIEKNYIVPQEYITRLKVILAYLVIVDQIKVRAGQKFPNLAYLVNYLKLDDNYKKILLRF